MDHDGRMDQADLDQVSAYLCASDVVAPADGYAVRVTGVSIVIGEMWHGSDGSWKQDDELLIDYVVGSFPPAQATQPLPAPWHESLEEYCEGVATELNAWATEHVRKFEPLPIPDRDDVARDLPSCEQLWEILRSDFTEVRDEPVGFSGVFYDDRRVALRFTAVQWQDFVIGCEIGCRADYGVDADSAGQGPAVAGDYVSELLASGEGCEGLELQDGRLSRFGQRATG